MVKGIMYVLYHVEFFNASWHFCSRGIFVILPSPFSLIHMPFHYLFVTVPSRLSFIFCDLRGAPLVKPRFSQGFLSVMGYLFPRYRSFSFHWSLSGPVLFVVRLRLFIRSYSWRRVFAVVVLLSVFRGVFGLLGFLYPLFCGVPRQLILPLGGNVFAYLSSLCFCPSWTTLRQGIHLTAILDSPRYSRCFLVTLPAPFSHRSWELRGFSTLFPFLFCMPLFGSHFMDSVQWQGSPFIWVLCSNFICRTSHLRVPLVALRGHFPGTGLFREELRNDRATA